MSQRAENVPSYLMSTTPRGSSYTAFMELTRAEVDEMLRHADEVRTKLRRATRELERFGEDVMAARGAGLTNVSREEAIRLRQTSDDRS